MQENNIDKKELIAEIYDISLDKNVDGKALYYLMKAIMEIFSTLN